MSRKRSFTYTFGPAGKPSFVNRLEKKEEEEVSKNDLVDVIEKIPPKELKELLIEMFIVEERNRGSKKTKRKRKRKRRKQKKPRKTRRGKKRTRRK